MVDISLCSGDGCKLSKSCYRTHAPRGVWQSMTDFPGTQGKPCIYFIEYKPSQSNKADMVKSD